MVQAPYERTKVVVRKLPPGLTEEGFKAAADKVAAGTYTWLSYHQGKVSTRKLTLSRAYLNFSEPRHVLAFKAAFDGHVFVTTKGNQYRCAVEYAPYQKVPQPSTKKNPLEGTLEQDPYYQAFLKELQDGPSLLPSAAAQREQQHKEAKEAAAQGTAGPAVEANPLIEYLKERHGAGGQAGRKGQRDRPGTGPKETATPLDKKGADARQSGGKAVGSGAVAAAKAAEAALLKADGRDKSRASGGTAATGTTAAGKAGASAAPVAPKALMARPKDAVQATAQAPPSRGAPPPAVRGRSGGPPPSTLTPMAVASALSNLSVKPRGQESGRQASAAAASSSGAGGSGTQQPRPAASATRTAAASTAAASAGAASAGAAATGAADAAGGEAPAAPARRVRAGFQAYRPPVRPSRDDDSG